MMVVRRLWVVYALAHRPWCKWNRRGEGSEVGMVLKSSACAHAPGARHTGRLSRVGCARVAASFGAAACEFFADSEREDEGDLFGEEE